MFIIKQIYIKYIYIIKYVYNLYHTVFLIVSSKYTVAN